MSASSEGAGGFHKLSETEIHTGYAIRVVEATFEAPAGETFVRDVIYHSGAVGVLPLDTRRSEPEVVFVRQYRAPIEELLLEIPAGLRDVPGEAPKVTAMRELTEEVGLVAGRVDYLGSYLVAAGMSDQRNELFLARDLTDAAPHSDGVEEDYMTIERYTVDEAWAMVRDGHIRDGKTIIGLTLMREFLSP